MLPPFWAGMGKRVWRVPFGFSPGSHFTLSCHFPRRLEKVNELWVLPWLFGVISVGRDRNVDETWIHFMARLCWNFECRTQMVYKYKAFLGGGWIIKAKDVLKSKGDDHLTQVLTPLCSKNILFFILKAKLHFENIFIWNQVNTGISATNIQAYPYPTFINTVVSLSLKWKDCLLVVFYKVKTPKLKTNKWASPLHMVHHLSVYYLADFSLHDKLISSPSPANDGTVCSWIPPKHSCNFLYILLIHTVRESELFSC